MKPKLKPPGTELLKVKCNILLPIFAFKFKLRRYTKVSGRSERITWLPREVRRCRLKVHPN